MADSEKIIADYRIVSRLGRGGMGVVYKGMHIHSGTPAAIKILPSEMAKNQKIIDRFLKEAHAATVLNHRNIVRIYEAGEFCGLYYIALEYIDGETLANALEREGKIPLKVALQITAQVAKGLEHAHERGIIHRDIKPGNIMITRDKTAKITDMGLAYLSHSRYHDPTKPGFTVGTPAYMSPEQVMTPDKMDTRSDIYSLGATLYHMLLGRPPHLGRNAEEVMTKVVKEEVHYPNALPAGVVAILKKMLSKEPSLRFKNARAVAEAIEKFLSPSKETYINKGEKVKVVGKIGGRKDERGIGGKITKAATMYERAGKKRTELFRWKGGSHLVLFVLLIVSEVAFVARQASGQESAQSNVEELVRKLGSDFYGDRQSAQMALAEKGAAVEDVMLKLLQESDDDSIRVAAISLLSRMNSRKAVPLLIELLEKSTRVTLRKAAIEGLSRYEPDSFSSLMEDYENLNESMKKFVVKLVEKMLIEHTKKQFHGGTFIIFPGQFDKFKKIRKAAGAAMRRLLEEWDSLEPEVLDPRALPILIAAAGDLKMEETKDVLRKMFDEGEPEADDAAAVSLALMGDRSRFDSLVKQYKEMAQEDSFAYATLAHLYHQVRDYKEAEGYYKKMLEVTPDSSIRANYACLLSISGREKEALAEMRKALATGLASKEWILYDGELENMRKLPEFKKLAEEYGLVLEEKEEK